jgi:hypothetical protein
VSDDLIRWLRYIIPALAGTLVGVLLERFLWQGRGQ